MKISNRRYCVLVICAAWFLLAVQSYGQVGAGRSSGSNADATQNSSADAPAPDIAEDPDIPPFAQGQVDKQSHLQKRAEHILLLRGLSKDRPVDRHSRGNAIRSMEQQERQRAGKVKNTMLLSSVGEASTQTAPVWSPIGPDPLQNGQTSYTSSPVSGRVTAIAVHPSNPNIIYVGAAQGGVYRSLDGGSTWTPLMDGALSLAIGAISIAPSQPSTIYVGTGEANFSLDSFFGVGVYRIDNADTNPVLVGPFNQDNSGNDVMTGRAISQILVHPTDPSTIFVSTTSGLSGVSGSPYKVLPAQGVYRSTNAAGASPVTFTKLPVGVVGDRPVTDLAMEPNNPSHIFVAVALAYGMPASGDEGYYTSTNALDATPVFNKQLSLNAVTMKFAINKVGPTLTLLAGSGDLQTDGSLKGTLRRSTDGGVTWSSLATASDYCSSQCPYDAPVAIHPSDANTFFLGGAGNHVLQKTTDGGASFPFPAVPQNLHADTHVIVFAPSSPNIMYTGDDGGIWTSSDTGDTWTDLNGPGFYATQFQSLALHKVDSTFMIGGTQDNGTDMRNSDGSWFLSDRGDGGYSLIDQSSQTTSNVNLYHTFSSDVQVGYARFSGATTGIQWVPAQCTTQANTSQIGCSDTMLFYPPMALGPLSPNMVYFGSDRLYCSADQGVTNHIVSQAPLVAGIPITSIGISQQYDNVRIVGLQNGKVFATVSGAQSCGTGGTLSDITGGIPACFVSRTVIDPQNSSTAYVTLSCYGLGAGQHVWKTTNLNNLSNNGLPTWSVSGDGIPDVPVSAFVIDPLHSSILYAGTDIGVYISTDGGATWSPYGLGLPRVAVFDMAIQNVSRVLRVATHGRGVWEIAAQSGATTTALSSSLNPSLLGQSVTFTATVAPAPPNGETVTFQDGTTTLGTGTLSSGAATFSTSSLTAGNHLITATYSGDNVWSASTGSLTQAVQLPADRAQFLSQSVPSTMIGGLYYHVTLNFKNTGNTTWDTTNYWLQSQNPSANTTWGLATVPISTTMYPGYFPTFYFVVRAPTSGTPSFQWQMMHGKNPFGDLSPNTQVNIISAPVYYQGCWVDDAQRALPTLLSSGGETVESCRLKAANKGLLFAGLQNSGFCFGGNNLGRSPAAEDECNMPCTANSSEICGGTYRNSIWSTVQVDVSWVKPSSASYGPANTLTVQGDALRGTGTVQMLWQDLTASGPWNTVAAQSTPSSNIWANTIPSSNYCHSYAVKAIYSGVTSQPFTYVGVSSGYCNETAWVSWIQPPWDYPGPAGSLVVAGGSSGAPAGTGVTLWWNDLTAGTGWKQGATVTPDSSGTWFNSIPNVNYSHQYSVYAVYDAYSTQTTQGPCTYPGNGGAMYCPR